MYKIYLTFLKVLYFAKGPSLKSGKTVILDYIYIYKQIPQEDLYISLVYMHLNVSVCELRDRQYKNIIHS